MCYIQCVAYIETWLETNWINLFQTVGIVLGLVFTSFSWRRDTRTRKLSNLLALKKEHRELWNIIHANPEFYSPRWIWWLPQ